MVEPVMLSAFSIFVLFVVLFALIFVGIAVKSVPQGHGGPSSVSAVTFVP